MTLDQQWLSGELVQTSHVGELKWSNHVLLAVRWITLTRYEIVASGRRQGRA
jgi:predicted Zn-dependent protease